MARTEGALGPPLPSSRHHRAARFAWLVVQVFASGAPCIASGSAGLSTARTAAPSQGRLPVLRPIFIPACEPFPQGAPAHLCPRNRMCQETLVSSCVLLAHQMRHRPPAPPGTALAVQASLRPGGAAVSRCTDGRGQPLRSTAGGLLFGGALAKPCAAATHGGTAGPLSSGAPGAAEGPMWPAAAQDRDSWLKGMAALVRQTTHLRVSRRRTLRTRLRPLRLAGANILRTVRLPRRAMCSLAHAWHVRSLALALIRSSTSMCSGSNVCALGYLPSGMPVLEGGTRRARLRMCVCAFSRVRRRLAPGVVGESDATQPRGAPRRVTSAQTWQ